MTEAERVARGLNSGRIDALLTLPLPRQGNPHLGLAARRYGDIWRKSSSHYWVLIGLERVGLVERKECRGETLWRLTRPLGLEVRSILKGERDAG